MQVRVTAQSQTHRLRERLEAAAVSHGAELRADLPNVRVTALAGAPDGLAFFCNMEPIRVHSLLASGDGEPLPRDVEVRGLEVPASGIEAIEVYPIGTLQDNDRLPPFPRLTPCAGLWSSTPAAIAATRGRRVGQTKMRNRGNTLDVLVIWTKGRR